MKISDHPRLMRSLLYGSLLVALVFLGVLAARKIQIFHRQTTDLTRQIFRMNALVEDKDSWEQRSLWIEQNIPRFNDRKEAVDRLIARIEKTVASRRDWNLKFESIKVGTAAQVIAHQDGGLFDRAFVDVTVSGTERDIIAWIHAMQNPASFQGIDRIAMELGYSGVLCEARISQWFVSPDPKR